MRSGSVVAFAVLVLASVGSPAGAQQIAEDPLGNFERRLIEGVLGGLGIIDRRPPIDYRERAPLVVPPARELRSPDDPNRLASNPAWPNDPDVAARNRAARDAGVPLGLAREQQAQPSSVQEIRAGAGRPVSRDEAPIMERRGDGMDRLPASQQVGRRQLNLFERQPEVATFEREPERRTLTQPPPGLQTPSANQPFGVGQGPGALPPGTAGGLFDNQFRRN